MNKPTDKQLLDIARTYFSDNMPTLKARSNDDLDFYEVAVWNIEAALTAAFNIGYVAAQKERDTNPCISAPSSES